MPETETGTPGDEAARILDDQTAYLQDSEPRLRWARAVLRGPRVEMRFHYWRHYTEYIDEYLWDSDLAEAVDGFADWDDCTPVCVELNGVYVSVGWDTKGQIVDHKCYA